MPDTVARWWLDLDHIRAHVGQEHAREGDREGLRDFQHPYTGEGAGPIVLTHGGGAYTALDSAGDAFDPAHGDPQAT